MASPGGREGAAAFFRARALLCALFLPVFLLAAPGTHAAAPAAAAPAPSAKAGADKEAIRALIRRLKDGEERQRLIRQLELLLEAGRKAPAQGQPAASSLDRGYARFLEAINRLISANLAALRRLPRKAAEAALRWRALFSEENTADSLIRLLVAVALTIFLLLALRRLMNRLLPGIGPEKAPTGLRDKLLRGTRRWVERALPPGALLLGGSALVVLFDLRRAEAEVLLIVLWAIFLQRAALGLLPALLSPEQPPWRLLPIGDGAAAYIAVWTRRLTLVLVWGEALSRAAASLTLDPDARTAIAGFYRLVLLLQALVLVSQQRERVKNLLSVTIPPGPAGLGRLAGTVWNTFASRWHMVAIPYFIVFYLLWSTSSEKELSNLIAATFWTLLFMAIALVVNRFIALGTRRLFAVNERLRRIAPGIEQRVNRYTPAVSLSLQALVWLLAALLSLDAWGIPALDTIFTPLGVEFLTTTLGIGITVVLAVGLIEVTRAGVNYYLTNRRDREGRLIEPSSQEKTLLPLGFTIVKWTVISVAAVIVLSHFGVDVGPILAGAGILGIAVGFGAQSLVKDIITGVFMLIENNIAVGDVVRVKDIGGLVEGFNLRSVRLRDYDGNVHVIPNSAIDVVTNFTKEYSRAVFDIGVSYRENVDEVIAVIEQVGEEMRADPDWESAILEPVEIAGLEKFADSAVVIRGRFKTAPIKQWSVRREFHRRIKKAFDARGIEIPFPYRTLVWAEPKPGERAAAAGAAAAGRGFPANAPPPSGETSPDGGTAEGRRERPAGMAPGDGEEGD